MSLKSHRLDRCLINNHSHQKKALSFMLKREKGWACDGSQEDLWAKTVVEGEVMYVYDGSSPFQSCTDDPGTRI